MARGKRARPLFSSQTSLSATSRFQEHSLLPPRSLLNYSPPPPFRTPVVLFYFIFSIFFRVPPPPPPNRSRFPPCLLDVDDERPGGGPGRPLDIIIRALVVVRFTNVKYLRGLPGETRKFEITLTKVLKKNVSYFQFLLLKTYSKLYMPFKRLKFENPMFRNSRS